MERSGASSAGCWRMLPYSEREGQWWIRQTGGSRLRAVANYLKHLSITPILSKVGLDELKTSHQASDEPTSNYAEALRDQIRVRTSPPSNR